MPKWSTERQKFLYTWQELGAILQKSRSSVFRLIQKHKPFTLKERRSTEVNSVEITWIDPEPFEHLADFEAESHLGGGVSGRSPTKEAESQKSETPTSKAKTPKTQAVSTEAESHVLKLPKSSHFSNTPNLRHTHIAPILQLKENSKERRKKVREVADDLAVSKSTVYNWIAAYEAEGVRGLAQNKPGPKRGSSYIPEETRQLVISAFFSNPVTTSAASIYRALGRAVPQAMTYSGPRGLTKVSVASIRRLKLALKRDPITRLLFMNEDERKEFMRTWAGQVISNHANDMWQLDMTRCDVMVADPLVPEHHPKHHRIYRPRVQAVIDVYSGCIPGIAFSQDESQHQADLTIRRGLFPKAGPFAHKYPVWGTPSRLYVDNGKIYTSKHFEGYMERLGVDVVHSIPYTSHTRGKIERFFGTLHSFEKTLPGYIGEDAVRRDNEQNKKLYKRTAQWLESGCPEGLDPWKGERFLTIDEYQVAVGMWLIQEYHQHVIDGMTRLEHFLESAPERSLLIRAPEEMTVLMGQHHKRTVRNAEFTFSNERYWIPDGSLARYQTGTEIIVIEDPFTLNPGELLVVIDDIDVLTPLGIATKAPVDALSPTAKAARKVKKAQKQLLFAEFNSLMERSLDPNLRVSKTLFQAAGLSLQDVATESQQAQITRPEKSLDSTLAAQKEDSTQSVGTEEEFFFNAWDKPQDEGLEGLTPLERVYELTRRREERK